jgi:hypothetical protein
VGVASREQPFQEETGAGHASAPAAAAAAPIAAGNAAIGRLLRARPELGMTRAPLPALLGNRAMTRIVQRYEAYEHARQGDRTKGSLSIDLPLRSGAISGLVKLSSGQINALADLYASPEDLWNADAIEVEKLKVLINRQMADPDSVKELSGTTPPVAATTGSTSGTPPISGRRTAR